MRMNKGQPFMDIESDISPDLDEIKRIYKGTSEIDYSDCPTFSFTVLQPALGKSDARFVLGVAEEYQHIIDALGPAAVKAILQVRPRLVQRLGVGEEVVESLEDAQSEDDLWREEKHPSEVKISLDGKSARQLWEDLHNEYRMYFEPEKSMERCKLRLYKVLTELLGEDAQTQHQEEVDRLPEKLKAKEERAAQLDTEKEAKKKRTAVYKALCEAVDNDADIEQVAREYIATIRG